MQTIDEYLNNLEPTKKAALERVRKIVKEMVPEAEETISYGMPTFKYKRRPLMYFATFKNHLSLFPASGKVIEQMSSKLEKYKTSKGTLQFTAEDPIPEEVIKEMLQIRQAEIAG